MNCVTTILFATPMRSTRCHWCRLSLTSAPPRFLGMQWWAYLPRACRSVPNQLPRNISCVAVCDRQLQPCHVPGILPFVEQVHHVVAVGKWVPVSAVNIKAGRCTSVTLNSSWLATKGPTQLRKKHVEHLCTIVLGVHVRCVIDCGFIIMHSCVCCYKAIKSVARARHDQCLMQWLLTTGFYLLLGCNIFFFVLDINFVVNIVVRVVRIVPLTVCQLTKSVN
jgi:hypothetical protein